MLKYRDTTGHTFSSNRRTRQASKAHQSSRSYTTPWHRPVTARPPFPKQARQPDNSSNPIKNTFGNAGDNWKEQNRMPSSKKRNTYTQKQNPQSPHNKRLAWNCQKITHFENTLFLDPGVLLAPSSSSPPLPDRLVPSRPPSVSLPSPPSDIDAEDENVFLETPEPAIKAQQDGFSWDCPRTLLGTVLEVFKRQEMRRSSQSLASSWFRRSSVAMSASMLVTPFASAPAVNR